MWNGLTFENTNSLAELNEDARFICDNFEFGDDDEKLGEMRPSGIDHHLHSLAKPIEHWNGDDVQFVAQFSFARPVFQRMEYWESLLELIEKQRWTFEEWQYRDIDGDSLVHGLAIWYARASLSDLDLSTMLAKYLKVLLRNGVDLHAVSGPAEETPLAALCVAGLNYGFNTERMANPTLQSWLYHLAAEGIDLAKYGEVEERLWRRRLRTTDRGMRMIGLAYGPRAQDWFIWTEHPGDSYAGIFWDLIEHPERRVPGAWQDCDEWLWEDEYFAELESERHYRKYLYQKELESRQQAVVEEVED